MGVFGRLDSRLNSTVVLTQLDANHASDNGRRDPPSKGSISKCSANCSKKVQDAPSVASILHTVVHPSRRANNFSSHSTVPSPGMSFILSIPHVL